MARREGARGNGLDGVRVTLESNVTRGLVLGTLSVWFLVGCTMANKKGGGQMTELQWGEPTEDLAISISVAEATFETGHTIELSFLLKNVGNATVPIVVRSPWIDYALTVQREDGTEIPQTPHALQMIEAAALGRRATSELTPGETLADKLELSKAYDMSVPGVYTVVATRETYKKGRLDQYATVKSNELTVQVVPNEQPTSR